MLDCPLPVEGLSILAEFLEVTDASTHDGVANFLLAVDREESSLINSNSLRDADAVDTTPRVFSLIGQSEAVLARAERQLLLLQELTHQSNRLARESAGLSLPLTSVEGLPARCGMDELQSAMHRSILRLMEERDEIHAQSILESTLHQQEMRQQEKKMSLMSLELQRLQALQSAGSASPDPGSSGAGNQKSAAYNSDEELVLLCQQLAGEITARTASELEVIRWKESFESARQGDLQQRRILEEQVHRAERLAAEERQVAAAAKEDAEKWRKAFELLHETLDRPAPLPK
jgi:hypothetical protein